MSPEVLARWKGEVEDRRVRPPRERSEAEREGAASLADAMSCDPGASGSMAIFSTRLATSAGEAPTSAWR